MSRTIRLPFHAKVIGAAVLAPLLLFGINQLETWALTWIHSSAIESVITLLGVLTALALWPAAIGLDGVHWSEIGRVWPYVFTLIALNVPWFYLLVGLGRLMRKLRSNKRPEVPTVQDERG